MHTDGICIQADFLDPEGDRQRSTLFSTWHGDTTKERCELIRQHFTQLGCQVLEIQKIEFSRMSQYLSSEAVPGGRRRGDQVKPQSAPLRLVGK